MSTFLMVYYFNNFHLTVFASDVDEASEGIVVRPFNLGRNVSMRDLNPEGNTMHSH